MSSAAAALPAAPVGVALAGNPNTGKTSLFNRLTGGTARVGNYPGVTVERQVGRWVYPGGEIELVDVPGAYSLAARSRDEQIALRAIFGLDDARAPAAVVVVVDATQLARNLYLAGQILEAGLPTVIALNFMDVARKQGSVPDPEQLTRALGVPVVALSVRTGEGIERLGEAIREVLARPELGRARPGWSYPPALEAELARIVPLTQRERPDEARAMALWSLLSIDDDDELEGVPEPLRREVLAVRRDAAAAGRDLDAEIIGGRYAWLDSIVQSPCVSEAKSLTEKIDALVLHPVLGGLVFLAVMGVIFQALFTWSEPLIGLVESFFGALSGVVRAVVPAGMFADLLVDGVIGGVGSVLVFLPQIVLLFLLLGFLEDSGYMARVAFLVDRGMKSIGLHGRAFVPMLSGFACAVPAVMATRTLERSRDRLLTMLVIPLMSCSARLPVYTLIIAALFAGSSSLFGLVPIEAAAMIGIYLFSTAIALVAAGVIGKTILKGPNIPLLLELPPYRLPRAATVARQTYQRAKVFVTEAGTVILACTVVLWALLYFPRDVALSKDYAALRSGAPPAITAQLDSEEAAERLQQSYGGRLGKLIEPVIAPLGFDWKIGIGLIGAFAAREVFISTLGVVYGLGDAAEEGDHLRDRIRAEKHADGTPTYTPLVGLSLMVFFALSAQCMSTLAAVRRESKSYRWPLFLFGYMTVLAWIFSFAVYQGGRLLGFA